MNKLPWTKQEEAKLMRLGKKFSGRNWNEIAKQCGVSVLGTVTMCLTIRMTVECIFFVATSAHTQLSVCVQLFPAIPNYLQQLINSEVYMCIVLLESCLGVAAKTSCTYVVCSHV